MCLCARQAKASIRIVEGISYKERIFFGFSFDFLLFFFSWCFDNDKYAYDTHGQSGQCKSQNLTTL